MPKISVMVLIGCAGIIHLSSIYLCQIYAISLYNTAVFLTEPWVLPIPLLECQQLMCTRDDRVLFSGLDLTVNTGEVVQIEGPNGCGKTTLLRVLATLLSDYQGRVLWQGHSIQQQRLNYLLNTLFIGHLSAIKNNLTPRENLRFLTHLHSAVSDQLIDQALVDIGLYGYEDTLCHHLSAGQSRRVGLARLYLSQAPIWILDEPYTAIDKQGIAYLETLFSQHTAKGGCIILTSHQPPLIDTLRRVALYQYCPQNAGLQADSVIEAGYD